MLKKTMVVVLETVTAVRFLDFLWFLFFKYTELSIVVLTATGFSMVLALLCVLFHRFRSIGLRTLILMYIVQAVVVSFNILYTSIFSPLNVTFADFLMIGNFFEIFVYLVFIYIGFRTLRQKHAVIRTVLHNN